MCLYPWVWLVCRNSSYCCVGGTQEHGTRKEGWSGINSLLNIPCVSLAAFSWTYFEKTGVQESRCVIFLLVAITNNGQTVKGLGNLRPCLNWKRLCRSSSPQSSTQRRNPISSLLDKMSILVVFKISCIWALSGHCEASHFQDATSKKLGKTFCEWAKATGISPHFLRDCKVWLHFDQWSNFRVVMSC